ncbi:MAG: hypothetical protein CL482_16455 [Acidobacteria bacterium]|nr:hypothetical protein [Acidobacteriota bacterium]
MVHFGTACNPDGAAEPDAPADDPPDAPGCRHRRNYLWAELMRRSLGLYVLACLRCGGRLRLIALIEDPPVIQRILQHRGLPFNLPAGRPARAPPEHLFLAPSLTQVVDETDSA